MAGFNNDFIDELKSRSDIISVISQYVPLVKKGSKYFCCCPFHNEKTPSMCVNTDGQYYHCFGCGVSGDVITFIMEMESLDYVEAVKFLAERANLTLPEYKGDDNYKKNKDRKERLHALMRDAAMYYHANLTRESDGAKARAYLEGRGITEGISNSFGLGLSLESDKLQAYMRLKGYTIKELEECGMVIGDNHLDPFAGRIMVPIFDGMGNVVAFGGRIYRGEENIAKYKNSANTVLFDKGRTVYGLSFLKRDKKKGIRYESVILVEGYMDVISLAVGGFRNAIAGMGTALTNEQAREIKKFSSNVYVCYDGDAAGRKATLRNVELLEGVGAEVKVVSLADGLDPDDTIKQEGPEGFQKRLEEALPVVEYKLKVCEDTSDMTTVTGRAKYVSRALSILAGIENRAEREVYYQIIASKTGISVDTLSQQQALVAVKKTHSGPVKSAKKTADGKEYNAARYVLNCVIRKCSYADVADAQNEWFPTEELAKIHSILLDKQEDIFSADGVDKKELGKITGAEENFGNGPEEDVEKKGKKMYLDCLAVLEASCAKKHIKELTDIYNNTADDGARRDILRQITDWQKKSKKQVRKTF